VRGVKCRAIEDEDGPTTGQIGCNMACSGNSSQVCGGSFRLKVCDCTDYIQPVLVQQSGAYNVSNCYNDSSSARTLGAYTWTISTAMTVGTCTEKCAGKKYVYAGLEVAGECYYGNALASTGSIQPLVDCKARSCTGNDAILW